MRSLILISIGSIIIWGGCATKQDSNLDKQIGSISNDKFFYSNTNIGKYEKQKWDENGIPLSHYNDTEYNNPVNICQAAIHYFEHYRIYNDLESKKISMRLANWLSRNFIYNQSRDFGGWYYPITIEKCSCDPPWLSAMCQGLALPVLYQAYKMTGDESYLQIGSKAINSFFIKVEDGGVLRYLDGSWWYEEYAGSKESYVLNGYIFALSGLEYWSGHVNGCNSKKAAFLFREGIKTLKKQLNKYDIGYWSYYDLHHPEPSYASPGYHNLHIDQLLYLYLTTGDPFFKDYAHKFFKYVFGSFNSLGLNLPKFNKVSASRSVNPENYGPDNIIDGNWTYGRYWSTKRYPAELVIDFGRKRDHINAIVFVYGNKQSTNHTFSIFYYLNGDWKIIPHDTVKLAVSDAVEISGPGANTTYVKKYEFPDIATGSIKVRIDSGPPIFALREINIHFDCRDEIDIILDKLKK